MWHLEESSVVLPQRRPGRVAKGGFERRAPVSVVVCGVVGELEREDEVVEVSVVPGGGVQCRSQVALDGLVKDLGETIGLRVVVGRRGPVDAQESAGLGLQVVAEFPAVVRHDGLGDAVQERVPVHLLGDRGCLLVADEPQGDVLGQRVDDDEDELFPSSRLHWSLEVHLDELIGLSRRWHRLLPSWW